jgi:hypothetical protein
MGERPKAMCRNVVPTSLSLVMLLSPLLLFSFERFQQQRDKDQDCGWEGVEGGGVPQPQ